MTNVEYAMTPNFELVIRHSCFLRHLNFAIRHSLT